MDLVQRWLAGLDASRTASLTAQLAELPGRNPGTGAAGGPPIESAEFSFREGSTDLRFAWNLDWERVGAEHILRFLRAYDQVPVVIADLLHAQPRGHYQIGLAGRRAKLYAYKQGRSDADWRDFSGQAAAVAGLSVQAEWSTMFGRANFVAFDLENILSAKAYLEHPTAGSAASLLKDLGASPLAELLEKLPLDLGSSPAAWVTSARFSDGGLTDVTLHVRIDRALPRLSELAGDELSGRASEAFRRAHRLGLVFSPTYLSFLWKRTTPVRSLYYRLRGRR